MGRLGATVTPLPRVALVRVPGWESRLASFIEARRHLPFAWGQQDCGLFAADAALELCGVDPAASLRGYATGVGSARALARHGLACVTDVPGALGLPPRWPIDARRGDVVSFRSLLGPTLGVCLGAKFAAPAERGLTFFPLARAEQAWRVG